MGGDHLDKGVNNLESVGARYLPGLREEDKATCSLVPSQENREDREERKERKDRETEGKKDRETERQGDKRKE